MQKNSIYAVPGMNLVDSNTSNLIVGHRVTMLTTEPHSLLPFSLWVKSIEIYKNGIQTTAGINLKTTELFLKEIVILI